MTETTRRRWYQPTFVESCMILSVGMFVVALLLSTRRQGDSHIEHRTTRLRMGIWLDAADEFESRNGRQIRDIEELDAFAFSDDCEFCNVADLRFDWWGTPLKIWIESDRHHCGSRVLHVRAAGGDRIFEDHDMIFSTGLGPLAEKTRDRPC